MEQTSRETQTLFIENLKAVEEGDSLIELAALYQQYDIARGYMYLNTDKYDEIVFEHECDMRELAMHITDAIIAGAE